MEHGVHRGRLVGIRSRVPYRQVAWEEEACRCRASGFNNMLGARLQGKRLYDGAQTCGRVSGENRHVSVERTTRDEQRTKAMNELRARQTHQDPVIVGWWARLVPSRFVNHSSIAEERVLLLFFHTTDVPL